MSLPWKQRCRDCHVDSCCSDGLELSSLFLQVRILGSFKNLTFIQSLSFNACTSGFHPQTQCLFIKREKIILNYSNHLVFHNFRGFEAIGPFVDMIYKMCAGDMSRFFIIYIIYLLGLAQGKYVELRTEISSSLLVY